MINQASNFGAQASLQPVILQSVCNPTARGSVNIVATKCLGKISSDVLIRFYNKLFFINL